MENIEKEVLNRYKLWQELFESNSDTNSKDANEYCLFDKDFDSSYSGCSGGSCRACGCRAD